MRTFEFADSAELDYSFDWKRWLKAVSDTIQASVWALETIAGDAAPLTIVTGGGKDASFTDYTTKVWLSGGTAGHTYTLTNTITTLGGRIVPYSVLIKVVATLEYPEEI